MWINSFVCSASNEVVYVYNFFNLIWLYLKIWTSSIFFVVELLNILIPSGPLANECFFFSVEAVSKNFGGHDHQKSAVLISHNYL